MSNSRLVYSTDGGRTCPKCGWPLDNCQCSNNLSAGKEAVPERPVAKLRMEKKGRGGKTVTVVFGLPNNASFLADLSRDLKRACGVGGTTTDDGLTLQGDVRAKIRELLNAKGFLVKG